MIEAYNWRSYAKNSFTDKEKADYIKSSIITDDTEMIKEMLMKFVNEPGIHLDLDDISSFLYLINDSGLISRFRLVDDFSYRNCKMRLEEKCYRVWNEYTIQCGTYNDPWFNKDITNAVTYWEKEGAEEIFIIAESKYWPVSMRQKFPKSYKNRQLSERIDKMKNQNYYTNFLV